MKLFSVASILMGLIILIFQFCQPLNSERLVAKSEYLVSIMSTESISQIIVSKKPFMNIVFNNTKFSRLSVKKKSSSSYSVFVTIMNAFTNSDSMLRMIIDKKRLDVLKGEDYIEITFKTPANLKIATGSSLSVSYLVASLVEEQTKPEWNFYYSQDSKEWFAVRWTNANSETVTQLKQQIQQLIETKQ